MCCLLDARASSTDWFELFVNTTGRTAGNIDGDRPHLERHGLAALQKYLDEIQEHSQGVVVEENRRSELARIAIDRRGESYVILGTSEMPV